MLCIVRKTIGPEEEKSYTILIKISKGKINLDHIWMQLAQMTLSFIWDIEEVFKAYIPKKLHDTKK